MSRDKQNIKTTDWLTRGMTEAEIAKVKEEAIDEADAELRDKQIEEMAKILCGMKNGCDGCMWNKVHCNGRNYAEEIYNAGYHKSEEVAREIFEEIETLIVRRMIPEIAWIDDRFITDFAELKKKYIGKDTNAPTNTEEGK